MKALVYHEYGSPDVLRLEDIGKPVVGDDQVLIRVRAASVNPLDWHFMRGTPYFLRMVAGLRKPKENRLGVDVAGTIEAVGRSVSLRKPGDEVFGACRGAFAEYACTPESAVVMKPDNITFEQAASVCVAALTALVGLRDQGQIHAGQKVLINGAAGGVGTFAVQIAKSFGAEVAGVCSARNLEMVRSIGADRVIDYAKEDFASMGQRYDLILDCVGNHSLSEFRRVLNPQGAYVAVGGPSGRWMIGGLLKAIFLPLFSLFGSQKFTTVLMRRSNQDLSILRELMASGKVTPVIDRSYGLTEVPEAIRYLEQGHARGKVVITVG